jgi:acyl-CoA thioester hydrolase/bile acid acetyltransferase-like protein
MAPHDTRSARMIRVLAVLVVAAAGLTGCTRGGDSTAVHASMSVSPQTALLDQPVAVSVPGLPAGARTTVTAKATDAGGTTWSASAQFRATSAGVVSLDQPSLGGSYSGVNPMGLFQLMVPPPDSTAPASFSPLPGYDVTLQATVDGRVAARAFPTPPNRPGPCAAAPFQP